MLEKELRRRRRRGNFWRFICYRVPAMSLFESNKHSALHFGLFGPLFHVAVLTKFFGFLSELCSCSDYDVNAY